jgi:quercetin dioxygenase-like cupin family protein
MNPVDRRSALAIGLAAASAAVVKPAASQTTDYTDTSPYPGVVQRLYGENPSLIPGFKTVSMRDIIMQPGSKTGTMAMPNDMICHMLEGELRHQKDGKPFMTKKNTVWTCNKGSFEQSFNDTNAVVIMRITDLRA